MLKNLYAREESGGRPHKPKKEAKLECPTRVDFLRLSQLGQVPREGILGSRALVVCVGVGRSWEERSR